VKGKTKDPVNEKIKAKTKKKKKKNRKWHLWVSQPVEL
jgi:hypothetical protein